MSSYLRAFTERAADLPSYLRRNLLLIRHLDEKVQALQVEIQVHSKKRLAAATGSRDGVKRPKIADPSASYDIDAALGRLLNLADEKVTVASQLYDYIDKHIQRLDDDLKAIMHEVEQDQQAGIGSARLSGGPSLGPHSPTSLDRGKAGRRPNKPVSGSAIVTPLLEQADFMSAPPKPRPGRPKSAKSSGSKKTAIKQPGELVALDPAAMLLAPAGEHEPLYCYCQRPSHGNMVACDNEECPFEWFHYECVGITEGPAQDQEWYCPECATVMREKRAAGLPVHARVR